MRVYVASDHAGFELKTRLIEWLAEQGYEPVDCGPVVFQPDDDYPPYVIDAARRTAADRDSFGVVIGDPAMASRSRRTRSGASAPR